MKYLSLIYLLFSFSVFADFDDYPNISSYLKGSDINKDKVFVLLNNKRLLSRDYHPTSFIRVRDEYPKYSKTLVKKGIEGYAEIGFTVNADGSTSNHVILNSEPGNYFDKDALIEAKELRYRKDTNSNYINTKGSNHKYRFTFNLPSESRKVPRGVFNCMELIYQDKYTKAKNCSKDRVSIHRGYTVPYAMALYFTNQKEEAINILNNLIRNPDEESFYVKALTASTLTNFLFAQKSYQEIIDLEPYLVDIRKVGYEESLINAFYFLGVSNFYADNTLDSLYYLKLTQQDSNCMVSAINSNDDIKATKAQSLFRLVPDRYCYGDLYRRTEETLKAIDAVI
jgi:TonB family protein|tara:strand:- start:5175 stop:6194 length:1020 start_codon:yes stop_codon:yes gene_type:complete